MPDDLSDLTQQFDSLVSNAQFTELLTATATCDAPSPAIQVRKELPKSDLDPDWVRDHNKSSWDYFQSVLDRDKLEAMALLRARPGVYCSPRMPYLVRYPGS